MAEATVAPETMDNGRRAEGAYRLQKAGGSGSCSPDSDASLRNARLTQALVRRSSPARHKQGIVCRAAHFGGRNEPHVRGQRPQAAEQGFRHVRGVAREHQRDQRIARGAPEPEDSRREQPAPGGGEHEAGQRLGARKTKGCGGDANVSFLRPHGRIHDQDHSGQDEQGEHQGCGEPAEAGAFPRSLADDGDKQEDGGEAVNHGGDRGHESDDARDGATEEAFFSAVLYGTGHADRERPAQEQGGDGQQERAHDHGQDAEFVGIRTPDPAEYLAPLCAEHDGQCEAGDEGEDGAHGSPGQPCRQQRESAAFRE